MFQKSSVTCFALVLAASLVAAAATPSAPAKLTAAEIVEKNIAVRGGLKAWHAVQSMSWEGTMGAGGNQRSVLPVPAPGPKHNSSQVMPQRPKDEAQLPFVMELKRPLKSRLEIQFAGQTAIQVFDGVNGWKLRPFLNRREVEPFSPEELKKASMQSELDGPLVDYAAKGTKIELVGIDKVEERNTYKLKLTMKSGQVVHLWIDAETFLETKIEGAPRVLDGVPHPVELYYRNYREVSGLKIPFLLETRVLPVARTAMGLADTPVPAEKIVIEKVVVNPKLDDTLFAKLTPTAGMKGK